MFVSSSDGYVYRLVVDLVPIRNMTTTAPIFPGGQRPLGLAFGPGGYLYVGSSNGRIKRFRLLNNMLVEGTDHGQFSGAASDLAFDTQGRLYVADGAATSRPVSIILARRHRVHQRSERHVFGAGLRPGHVDLPGALRQ